MAEELREFKLRNGKTFKAPKGTPPAVINATARRLMADEPLPTREPSTLESVNAAITDNPVGRVASEFGAGIGRGAAQAADFFTTGPVNAALEMAGSDTRIPTIEDTLSPATVGGFMEPGLGRDVVRTAGELVPAAAGAGAALRGAAQRIPEAVQTVGQGVTRQLGQSTAAQDVTGAVLSGVGAEVGEEVGGETGRAIGAIATPLAVPLAVSTASNTIRRIIRGSDKNIPGMNKVISDFLEVDEMPTVAQATGREGQQSVENISRNIAGGAPIVKKSRQVSAAIQKRVLDVADDISRVEGAESAGLAIQRGITGRGGFVDRFLSKSSNLWSKSDGFIPDDAQVSIGNVKSTLNNLVRDGKIGQILNNPKLSQIKDALGDTDTVDYRTLRDIRSLIGQKLGNKELISDIPRAELKQVYGALSEDIKTVARNSGDDALKAFNRANAYTRTGHQRMDNFVERITKKVDLDKIFEAVTKGGEGTRVINTFKRSLKPDEWDIVVSNVVRKLGRSTPGQQNASGDAFSVNKFLTDWNKLGKARNSLLSGTKKLDQYRESLNKIANVTETVKESARAAANPSGSGQFVTNVGIGTGTAASLATGNVPLATTILSTVAMNNAGARLMTNPRFVQWLATKTLDTTKLTPGHITALVKLAADSDIDDAAAIQTLIEELEQ